MKMKQEVLDFMQTRILTSSNYSQWIKELKNLTKRYNVWQYIDPQNDRAKELNLNDYADVQDIDEDDIDILLLDDDDEMTDDELELYCLQMKKRRAKKIASNMKIVHAALKMTAKISEITCIRDVVKSLAARFDSTLNQQSQNVVNRSVVNRPVVNRSIVNRFIVNCSIVDFLNWFQMNWFNDENWLKTYSTRKRTCSAVSFSVANTASSSIANSLDWFERAWFDDTQWLKSSHTVNAVAEMKKPCTVDTVNENSHTVDTVDSAMKNACKNVSYSNNSHIILELNSHIDSELNSESEGHTGHDLISWIEHTDHDLILESEQDRIFYIIKKMMKKFLDDLRSSIMRSSNMKSSTKTSNSVDQEQCKKISLDLDELNQDQIIQITNEMKFHLKIQSSINQRNVTDEFCRCAKYEHFRPAKDEHFGSDKDEFYMPDKWFRAWCDSAFFKAEKMCQAISDRLVEVD